ncbi:MAG: septation protein A [Gammaproteobacteria bacterium]|nr:septation protein A [Gammaproteobacteria bacterium]
MKLLIDFFPILLFFIAYKTYDIYVATMVAIAASVVQVAYIWTKHRRVENMHLITLALVVVFGGATLLLEDEMFIKWKPTVVNWLFAVAFLGSQFIGEKNLVERMMGASITLERGLWAKLNWSWVLFFVFLGVVNLYVVYNFDTDTWVNFKLFGMMGLTLAFLLIQGFFLMKHIEPEGPNKGDS